jgi:5-methylcytosine-specific restriction endonuclease McrA
MAGQSGKGTPAWKGAKNTYTCENCGSEFKEYPYVNDNKYCSESCYREAAEELFVGENNPAWRGGRVDNYGPNWGEDCGKDVHEMDRSPDVHHKKRLGWFKEEYDAPEWYEKGNRLENLVTLCQRCHAKREWSNGAIQE